MAKPAFVLEQIERFISEASMEGLPQNGVFCMVPWVHFHVTQYGTVTPCCLTPWDKNSSLGDINKQSIEEIWNSEATRLFRLRMLKGEPDARCVRCYTLEKAGNSSARIFINKLYSAYKDRLGATRDDGFLPSYKPVYLDIRFSNKCNFKCRICGPHSSSAWYDDAIRAGDTINHAPLTQSIADPAKLFVQLQPCIAELQEIYFAGGEPLFIDEHYQLLDVLLKAGKDDVLLRYSTNFSSLDYERGKAIDYWKQFKKVMVTASLDDMGQRAELHRKGQNWEKTVHNLKRLRQEASHVYLMVSPTLSIWNIWTVCDMHRWLSEQGFIETDDLLPNVLEQPEYFSIRVLPVFAKEALSAKLKEHARWIRARTDGYPATKIWLALEFEKIADSLFADDRSALLPQLLAKIRQIDSIRNEDTFAVIPELRFLIESPKAHTLSP